MNTVEIAEILNGVDMYELACKTNAGYVMTDNESTAVAELDRQFKKIGEEGHDPNLLCHQESQEHSGCL